MSKKTQMVPLDQERTKTIAGEIGARLKKHIDHNGNRNGMIDDQLGCLVARSIFESIFIGSTPGVGHDRHGFYCDPNVIEITIGERVQAVGHISIFARRTHQCNGSAESLSNRYLLNGFDVIYLTGER
ncbi:hypothetical protein KSAC_31200 (plasmid) [Komagataeibacter saccharivorans]|nr:hypothetical protein KSAC_31200 [Komagataeibacter saccharivorans]